MEKQAKQTYTFWKQSLGNKDPEQIEVTEDQLSISQLNLLAAELIKKYQQAPEIAKIVFIKHLEQSNDRAFIMFR